jgi:uncharacterized protein
MSATLRVMVLVMGAMAAFALARAGSLPVTTVELGGQTFTVEVAADDYSRMRGLMFRDTLAQDHGMLFVFDSEQPLAFWMKNTRIALDILYFDEGLRLVSIAANTPPCTTPFCPSYPSGRPARYVLELNAGIADGLALEPGASTMKIAPPGS